MIIVDVRCDSIRNIERRLGNMERKAKDVLKNAVNDTAKQAQRSLAGKAKETYMVKVGGFKRYMKLKKANKSFFTAIITATGEPIPMVHFKFSPAKPDPSSMNTIKIKVLKKGGFKEIVSKKNGNKAFANNIARKGQVRNRDTKKGQKGSKVTHIGIAQRDEKERLHIHELYSVSVPQMIKSKHVYGKIEPEIRENLEQNIQKHIEKVI